MKKGRDGGKGGEKRGEKEEKTDENSGHYVVASSLPPEPRHPNDDRWNAARLCQKQFVNPIKIEVTRRARRETILGKSPAISNGHQPPRAEYPYECSYECSYKYSYGNSYKCSNDRSYKYS